MEQIELKASIRNEFGKNASRRLRRRGLIPAIFYGPKEKPTPLAVDPHSVVHVLRSGAGRNAILSLLIDGKRSNAMIKDFQVDPIKGNLLHVDFLHIAMDVAVKVRVPIRIVGEAAGARVGGGILELVAKDIEISCLPGDIPGEIKVDVSNLNVGDVLRVADLPEEPKIKYVSDPETVIVTVIPPETEETKAEEAPAVAEPEVIGKGKAAKEEAPEEGEAAED